MRQFNAEVSRVLQIVIHSLYTNKDVFLRELISNASDACEKLRYLALSYHALSDGAYHPKITVHVDSKAGIISVRDNGIGMNEDELVHHLGTIAKSGTLDFLEKFHKSSAQNNDLIGQFGVGFYASFMIADKVDVKTTRAGEDGAHSLLWTSNGTDGFEVKKINENLPYGTEVIVYLKETERDTYLNKFKIENIIKTYSEHITTPIEFKYDEEESAIINEQKAIWLRNKSDITKEEYENFCYSLCPSPSKEHILLLHNTLEGVVNFTSLVFIPDSKPFDIYHPDRNGRVALYVRHVFIGDKNIELLPRYMRFVYGIIDSSELPLNVSRETLQDSIILAKIRDTIIKKIFSELESKAENDPELYQKFWKNFGDVFKEGLCESNGHRQTLMSLLRFYTTKSTDKLVSLSEYINRMHAEQKEIYYFVSDNVKDMLSSPQIETFTKNDLEVILFSDVVDSFWLSVVHDHDGKDLKSITRADIDLSYVKDASKKEEEKVDSEQEKDMTAKFMKALDGKISAVKISTKLIDSPVCISVNPGSMDMRMEQVLLREKQLNKKLLKILEINPSHPLITKAYAMLCSGSEDDNKLGEKLVDVLLGVAMISDGESLSDHASFGKRVVDLLCS